MLERDVDGNGAVTYRATHVGAICLGAGYQPEDLLELMFGWPKGMPMPVVQVPCRCQQVSMRMDMALDHLDRRHAVGMADEWGNRRVWTWLRTL